MAEKIIILKIFEQLKFIVRASFDDSHFLPFTHNRKHDSGGHARHHNYFFVAPLLAFPLKKLSIVALYLLSRSRNLPLRSTGVSFSRLENTLKTASSFLAGRNAGYRTTNA